MNLLKEHILKVKLIILERPRNLTNFMRIFWCLNKFLNYKLINFKIILKFIKLKRFL